MRNKRLIWLLRKQCSLSMTEACAVVTARRRGDDWSSEACNHYGGVSKCLREALQARTRQYSLLGHGSPRMYWAVVESFQ